MLLFPSSSLYSPSQLWHALPYLCREVVAALLCEACRVGGETFGHTAEGQRLAKPTITPRNEDGLGLARLLADQPDTIGKRMGCPGVTGYLGKADSLQRNAPGVSRYTKVYSHR